MATSNVPWDDISIKNSCAHRILHASRQITFPELSSSASSCRICCIYRDIALDCVRGHLPGISEAFFKNETEEKLKLESLVISEWHELLSIELSGQEANFEVFTDARADAFEVLGEHLRSRYRVGRYTNSKDSFERAREWVSECVAKHACPKPITAGIPLPKRLINVEGTLEDPVRLLETRGDEFPYVCLSHRWGDPTHKQLKTTTRTLDSHMKNIEWESLPATFKDAVTVCRSMDVKYLWIDSLCILQSFADITPNELEVTRQDFAQENSNMARTYQHSHFTISADLSDHMDSGFFSRDPVDEYRKEVTTDSGNQAFWYIRKRINHYREDIPCLETRGWTLQEFLLPPRVLHFGKFDIAWRCKTRITCECGHIDRQESMQSHWHRFHMTEEATKPPPNDWKGALKWWEQVVHAYTSRQLTNPADKLPALSGLAQQRKQVRGGVYLAGLWQDSLLHDLCWYHVSNYNMATSGGVGYRPPYYRAPSWSWAAVDTDSGCSWWWTGPIGLHSILLSKEPKQACAIVQVSCEPATTDPTGEVQSGFLDIKTSLASAEICRDPEERVLWTIHKLDPSLRKRFLKPDCVLEEDVLKFGDQIFCAPVAGIKRSFGLECACLVLKQIDGNIYQRVGFCTIGLECADFQSHHEDTTASDLEDFAWPGSEQVQIRIV
ncbi:uncharacterized protein FFE2_15391 [Fusarium fujikuroi]|uniref:Heterokaryon incompatibility domain-containing protein n=1 Tax=Fusarium fujikuroi TaxID=5127 RepID=A0A9Q9RA82_FUSFU|nr:uncharacterized protein FFE2_15391 [Fusarium fujikuroi]VTT56581.1 unnamed protein product [Fusarium fujikuroi]